MQKILIFEDDNISSYALELMIKGGGYASAGREVSGANAVELVKEKQPDVILMDIRLAHGTDGIEAARQIRSISDIPIIFLSAYNDTATLKGITKIPNTSFANKPYQAEKILSLIKKMTS